MTKYSNEDDYKSPTAATRYWRAKYDDYHQRINGSDSVRKKTPDDYGQKKTPDYHALKSYDDYELKPATDDHRRKIAPDDYGIPKTTDEEYQKLLKKNEFLRNRLKVVQKINEKQAQLDKQIENLMKEKSEIIKSCRNSIQDDPPETDNQLLLEENSRLKSDYAQLQIEYDKLKATPQSNAQLIQALTENSRLKSDYEKLLSDHEELKNNFKNTTKLIQEKDDEIGKLKTTNQDNTIRLSELENQLKESKTVAKDQPTDQILKKTLAIQLNKNKKMQALIEAYKQAYESLQEKHKKSQQRNQILQAQNSDYKRRIQELETQFNERITNINQLFQEYSEITISDEQTQKIAELEQLVVMLKERIDTLQPQQYYPHRF